MNTFKKLSGMEDGHRFEVFVNLAHIVSVRDYYALSGSFLHCEVRMSDGATYKCNPLNAKHILGKEIINDGY